MSSHHQTKKYPAIAGGVRVLQSENQAPGQLGVEYIASAVVAQVQPVVALRVRVMTLPNTGAGALSSVQVMVPAPLATVPVTPSVQFCVAVSPPPTTASVGSAEPALITSSKPL